MSSRADDNLDQRFERLYRVIRSESFLGRRGLGNELPFFISAHHPALQGEYDQRVPSLATRLNNEGVPALLLNLYDAVVEMLQARGLWPRLMERERSLSKEKFFELMRNVTDPKEHLVPFIAAKLASGHCQVLLIDGVGLVFPYIRSHTVLENLQSVTKQTPTILFFPGDYTFTQGRGSHLKLFGTLPDDRYYRAFNIADFEP